MIVANGFIKEKSILNAIHKTFIQISLVKNQNSYTGRIWKKHAISMKASFHIYLYGRCKTCHAEEKMKNM